MKWRNESRYGRWWFEDGKWTWGLICKTVHGYYFTACGLSGGPIKRLKDAKRRVESGTRQIKALTTANPFLMAPPKSRRTTHPKPETRG